ncbi:O-acetylhomoserine aminocarboxypropyltransferase/cysteine synthase family protein [Thermospira aquatica]|uniref:O-succinylhomoserine sulfhydrylase n=1 Tax=Thermospira aquatica TaxID=2828656 RepID=A0AAX3BFH6_9SPIR|nr:O-acetylhomoserine aminocarboxypropyltransferase/cysteine synthase family protein [Thermospira aquatica]URA11029.1 O-acetylhomoserine aminocarboxypropyltransferase/cysteine synthase [Thermospira aquatica]
MKTPNFETLALHAGQTIDETLSRAVPVYRTTSYLFKSSEHAANLFALKELGNIYTRIMNPTTDVLEKRMATLEGGVGALALASGTNAIHYAIINLAKAGDEIVSANNLYGGTFSMFHDILPQFGITTRFVDIRDPENVRKAINEKTRAVFVETIGNPALDVTDIEKVAQIAHENEVPLIVDSTFTTPYLFRPIEYGADIVVHSLTKWIGGHGTAIGGIVIDSGKFNWKNPKFSLFVDPDGGYHNLRFAYDLGELSPLAYIMRMRLVPLRNLGGCISPDNAWIFLQGLETLALRMERHSSNALEVARFLKKHPKVAWVRYPGLEDDPTYPVAVKYLKKGFGGMVVFGVRGGRAEGQRFIENLKLFSHLANVGDAKSLAIHPASTTHSQLSDEDLQAGGITPDLIRLSIGIEHIDDILADLEQALAKL